MSACIGACISVCNFHKAKIHTDVHAPIHTVVRADIHAAVNAGWIFNALHTLHALHTLQALQHMCCRAF